GWAGKGVRVSLVCCLLPSSKQTSGCLGSWGRWYTSKTSSIAHTKSALACAGMHHCSFSQGLSSFFLASSAPSHMRPSRRLPIQSAYPPAFAETISHAHQVLGYKPIGSTGLQPHHPAPWVSFSEDGCG